MKRRKFLVGSLTLFSALLVGCGEGTNMENRFGEEDSLTNINLNQVLLPLYSYPAEWETNNELLGLMEKCDSLISIINPSSGPDTEVSQEYIDGIDFLVSKNSKVIAYIATGYGDKKISDIYSEIDRYFEFYGSTKITGIFFDEVSFTDTREQDLMKDISDYARSKGFEYIVANPGTSFDQSIIDENYYDLIVTYENPYDKYLTHKNTLTSSSKTKQSLLIYDFPNQSDYSRDIDNAKNQGFDYIYFTTDTIPNPWDTVFNFLN
jgi:uncharacterized protein YktA (UPF0223 family)